MQRYHAVFFIGLVAVVGWGLSLAGGLLLSWISALTLILLLPAFAAALWAESRGPGAAAEQAVYAYGGMAVSGWSVWGASLIGLGTGGLLLAPVFTALALAALAPRFRGVATPSPTMDQPCDAGPTRAVWMAVLVLVVLVSVPFLPYGREAVDGVHRMSMTDWYKHLTVAAALQEGGFPPHNPYLLDHERAPYYYGFHLLAASLGRVTGGSTDPFHILFGLTLVTAAAFPLALYVVTQGLFADRRRAAAAAVAGSLLAGFDLVVWLFHAIRDAFLSWPIDTGVAGLRSVIPSSHLDFWIHHNERQLNPPYVTALWAPHHLAAVVMALLVIHMLRPGSGEGTGRRGLLPVLLLAAMPAMSAYVAVALASGVAVSMLVVSWRQRLAPWRTEMFRDWGRIAAGAGLLALPVLWVLAEAGGTGALTLAPSSAGGLLNGAVFSAMFGDNVATRLLDTPVLYLVEFGVVGWLGVMAIRDRTRHGELSEAQRHAVFILFSIIVVATLVRPPVGGPNNLYARPMVLAWSLLACFAADGWYRMGRGRVVPILVAVCAAGTVVAALGATTEGLLFGGTSRDTVEAARWINSRTDPDSVVAFRPPNRRYGYWLRRRVVAADRRHALLFGATDQRYDDVVRRLDDAYASPSASDASSRFRALGADVIVVERPLPSWVRPPCFDVGHVGSNLAVVTQSDGACEDRP